MLGSGLREVSTFGDIDFKERTVRDCHRIYLEGMRPLMIEIQSLVSTAVYGTPQRSTTLTTPRD
jgi:DNA repair protein RadA/Sms